MNKYQNLTKPQKDCVFFDNGNALVSASAGSGKTHVIIERIIRLVSEKNVPVERILAMTFTNLAAGEMKEKLKKALINEYNQTKNPRLKEEISKVGIADINTIHAFCSNLLRKYFYRLGLDANFEIIDEKKAEKLKNEAIDSLFESLYEEKDQEFFYLLSVYRRKRSDLTLRKIIFKLEEFSQRFASLKDLEYITISSYENLILNEQDEYLTKTTKKGTEKKLVESREEKVSKLYSSYEISKKLLNLLKKFIEKYENVKKENSAVDFEDLQSLTISLLENEDIKKTIQNSYDYVFVDEYQDVNYKQEKLINLVSNKNTFEVGDSKQSIYAFRGCNPKFFNEKFARYKEDCPDKKTTNNQAIALDYNFRSAKNIIETVNKVFGEIFVEEFSGTNYSDNPMIYGELYPDFEGKVEYHIVENEKIDIKDEVDSRGVYSVLNSEKGGKTKLKNSEHLIIAKLILETVGKRFYYDIKEKDLSKRLKPYTYADICILVRSLSSYTEDLTSTLIEYGIPVSSNGKMSIGEYPEIKVLLNLLSLICQANQDIPLASTMLNLFDFNENELAKIRANQDKNISFFKCLKNISLNNDELGCKVKGFLNKFEEIRLLAEFAPANEVLNKVIKDSKWDIKLLASENGEEKLKRVEAFIYESCAESKEMKVKEFNQYITKFIEKINVLKASGENTVKIMTAHASKGLEFPLVILTGLGKRYNIGEDTSANVLLSEDYGIAPKSFDFSEMKVSENSLRKLIKEEFKKSHSIEEARLLYVEFTRAKCELHLIIGEEPLKESREKEFFDAKKPTDFLTSNDAPLVIYKKGELLKFALPKNNKNRVIGKLNDSFLANEIKENLLYKYPYSSDTILPLKASASTINKVEEYFETTSLFGSSSSEKGTAYHRFLELSKMNVELIEKEKQEFLDKNLISQEEFDMLDTSKLKSILSMEIFKEFESSKVLREQKFCKLVSAKTLGFDNSNEEILVQGIIDCILIKDNKATLLDYKLSTIKNDEDIIKAYKMQMLLYKNAIEGILNIKVDKVFLVNVLQEKIIEINV